MKNVDKECISRLKLFEKLVRLETVFSEHVANEQRALVLAREIQQKDLELAHTALSHKLDSMNQFIVRIDRMEGSLVTKDALEKEVKSARYALQSLEKLTTPKIDAISKVTNMGIGVLLTIQVVFMIAATVIHFWK